MDHMRLRLENGTEVDGKTITDRFALDNGSSIVFGNEKFHFHALPAGTVPAHSDEQTEDVHATIEIDTPTGGIAGVVPDGRVENIIRFCVSSESSGCCRFSNERRIWFENGLPMAAEWDGKTGLPGVVHALHATETNFSLASEPYPDEALIRESAEFRLQQIHLGSQTSRAAQVQERQLGPLPEIEGWTVAVCYEPFESVSGDFYYATQLANKKYRFFVGDVSGHGTQAALVASQCVALLGFSAKETTK